MPSGRSFYQRRPEGRAKEKKEFQRLIEKLKRLALERGYTKNQIATELGVSNTCIYQWWAGYSLSAKRRTIERLKTFLSLQYTAMPNKPLPQFVEPMAAASVKEPFDSPDWIFEPKLDGYRVITVIDSTGKARLWSRNHLPLEPRFPTIQDAVNELKLRSTILDGEIVALDKDGIPRFQLLQQWQKRPTAPVVLYLFDLLWSDGRDITGKRVLQRRERLEQIINPVPGIQVGSYVENRGIDRLLEPT